MQVKEWYQRWLRLSRKANSSSCSFSGLVAELQQWLMLSLLWSMVITSIGLLTCKKCELWDTRDGSLVYSDFCSCREPRFISQNPHGGLPIPINSTSRKSDTLFWPPRASPIYTVHKHKCKPTFIHIKIIAKKFKRRNTDSWAPHGMPTATLFYMVLYVLYGPSMVVRKPGAHMNPSLGS